MRLPLTLLPRRTYATHQQGGPQRRRLLQAEHVLSLDAFLQRSRVLALYRLILRGTGRIGDEAARSESRAFARGEFERHRGVKDLGHVRYLLSTGKTEWEAMERYIGSG